jgi:hypothetical protein
MADETVKLITCEEAGRTGGLSRARKLSPEQRREIARRAAAARWAKKTGAPDPTDPKGPKDDRKGDDELVLCQLRRPPLSASSRHLGGRNLAAAA